ncbi:MAG: hypothetical protein LBK44_02310 [Spirochaetales bacterium]|nr:hypothetical protein [Spirochaetales bacterium]
MQILWAFRCNAPEDGRFPICMDCSGRYRAPGIPRAAAAQDKARQIAGARNYPLGVVSRLRRTKSKAPALQSQAAAHYSFILRSA